MSPSHGSALERIVTLRMLELCSRENWSCRYVDRLVAICSAVCEGTMRIEMVAVADPLMVTAVLASGTSIRWTVKFG